MKKFFIIFLILSSCLSYQTREIDYSKWGYNFVKIQDRTIHYNKIGKGKPVVFLHGFASYHNIWIIPATILKDNFESLLFDVPGFGLSDRKEDTYTPDRIAEILYEALKKLGYNRVSLIGHSWGASIALSLALKYPDFVEKIVIVDGWIYPQQQYSLFEWAKKPIIGEILFALFYTEQTEYRYQMGFYDKEKYLDHTLVTSLKEVYKLEGTKMASLAVVRGLSELEDLSKNYNTIKNKTLIVWCKNDPVVELYFGEKLANAISNSKLTILPQCGHFPMIEQNEKFAEILKEFL